MPWNGERSESCESYPPSRHRQHRGVVRHVLHADVEAQKAREETTEQPCGQDAELGSVESLPISALLKWRPAFSAFFRALMVATHWSSLLRMTMHSRHWMHSS